MSGTPLPDPALNPCRLCGQGAYFFQTFYGNRHWDAACVSSHCSNQTDVDDVQKRARRAWNDANPITAKDTP